MDHADHAAVSSKNIAGANEASDELIKLLDAATDVLRNGDLAQASVILETAIRRVPHEPQLLMVFAGVLKDAGEIERADLHLAKALMLLPEVGPIRTELANAFSALSFAWARSGRSDRAGLALQRAHKAAEVHGGGHSSEARSVRGDVRHEMALVVSDIVPSSIEGSVGFRVYALTRTLRLAFEKVMVACPSFADTAALVQLRECGVEIVNCGESITASVDHWRGMLMGSVPVGAYVCAHERSAEVCDALQRVVPGIRCWADHPPSAPSIPTPYCLGAGLARAQRDGIVFVESNALNIASFHRDVWPLIAREISDAYATFVCADDDASRYGAVAQRGVACVGRSLWSDVVRGEHVLAIVSGASVQEALEQAGAFLATATPSILFVPGASSDVAPLVVATTAAQVVQLTRRIYSDESAWTEHARKARAYAEDALVPEKVAHRLKALLT